MKRNKTRQGKTKHKKNIMNNKNISVHETKQDKTKQNKTKKKNTKKQNQNPH